MTAETTTEKNENTVSSKKADLVRSHISTTELRQRRIRGRSIPMKKFVILRELVKPTTEESIPTTYLKYTKNAYILILQGVIRYVDDY